jgi:hypothetical protein
MVEFEMSDFRHVPTDIVLMGFLFFFHFVFEEFNGAFFLENFVVGDIEELL